MSAEDGKSQNLRPANALLLLVKLKRYLKFCPADAPSWSSVSHLRPNWDPLICFAV